MFRSYRGVGVQVSTHVLDLKLQLVLRALVGTLHIIVRKVLKYIRPFGTDLESKVLEEVGGSVGLVSL